MGEPGGSQVEGAERIQERIPGAFLIPAGRPVKYIDASSVEGASAAPGGERPGALCRLPHAVGYQP